MQTAAALALCAIVLWACVGWPAQATTLAYARESMNVEQETRNTVRLTVMRLDDLAALLVEHTEALEEAMTRTEHHRRRRALRGAIHISGRGGVR